MKTLALLLAVLVTGCAVRPAASIQPADAFLAQVNAVCGQAFEGRVAADTPTASPDFAGKRLVMHVRDCGPEEVRIPFHVGEDRSRTWILTRTPAGLRLKHDHRHADGSPDVLTMYGGETATPGSPSRQAFPVDVESKALFVREDRSVSTTNVWAMEIDGKRAFTYELSRPNRLFRVEFDLTRPVPPPH